MTLLIFAQCNGPGCTTILGLEARTQSHAREETAAQNWTSRSTYAPGTRDWVTEDYCPEHPPPGTDVHPDRVPRERCPLGERCPALYLTNAQYAEVYHWCGHDPIGHRLANALTRGGFTTVAAVENAEQPDILDLRNVGITLFRRWDRLRGGDRAAA